MLMGYGLPSILVFLIVVAAAIAITLVIVRQMGVAVPAWVVQIAWILALVVVGILALRLLFALAHGL